MLSPVELEGIGTCPGHFRGSIASLWRGPQRLAAAGAGGPRPRASRAQSWIGYSPPMATGEVTFSIEEAQAIRDELRRVSDELDEARRTSLRTLPDGPHYTLLLRPSTSRAMLGSSCRLIPPAATPADARSHRWRDGPPTSKPS